MRAALYLIIGSSLSLVAGCAAYDAMMPHLRKPYSWNDSARQAQQDAYDRQVARSSGGTRNGVRNGLMGSSSYIPGASSNPFAP